LVFDCRVEKVHRYYKDTVVPKIDQYML
jgi:hypothetical protein